MSFPETVLKKALDYVRYHGVSWISSNVYSVRSNHPKLLHTEPFYMVKKNSNGKWVCGCVGFEKRGICSHVIAIMIVEARKNVA